MFRGVSSSIRLGVAALGVVALTVSSGAKAAVVQKSDQPTLSAEEEKRFSDAWVQQPRVNFGEPAGTAKVVIVKFNDWLCGACKQWHEAYQPIIDRFNKQMPGSVKLVLKDWPWNDRCNFTMSRPLAGHEGSCEAAVAVRLARERGKEQEMIGWLFGQQDNLINMRLQSGTAAASAIKTKATELLALKSGDFDREYPSLLNAVKQDVSNGAALKVESTPTYYVNGIKTTVPVTPDGGGGYNIPPEYFEMGIKLEMKKALAAK